VEVVSLRRALGGIVAGDFSDPTNERIIYLSAAGLAIVGLGLLVGTLVWWRRGRQEHPALAPLEVMSGRAWANAPEGEKRRRLEQVRLAGAAGAGDERIASEHVDLEALVRSVPQAFDDLREPSAVIDAPDAVAADDDDEPDVVEPDAAEPEVAETDAAETDAAEEEVVAPEADKPSKPVVAPVDVDATSISTERPVAPPESSAKASVAPAD
jgi:hypothetical protein